MKYLRFLFPIILILGFTTLTPKLLSGNMNKGTLLIILAVFLFIAFSARPRKKAAQPAGDLEEMLLGDYAKDAFAGDVKLQSQFRVALKNYSDNLPKAALNKLQKLAPECTTDQQTYAVSMATATVLCSLGKHREAIRHYNKALVLHPTVDVAMTLGSCYQRQGELRKARDTYEFALDLDDSFLNARSSIATTYVADGDYDTALEHALLVLEKDENHASALATAAICYALLKDPIASKGYQQRAVDNGYSEKKITETISALKRR